MAWLYRCKPNWTEKTLILSYADRHFVISSGVLYTYAQIGMENWKGIAINLTDFSVKYANYPDYNVYGPGCAVVYNDMIFYCDNNNIYRVVNGQKKLLATNAYLDGGFTSKYLYYAEYNWELSDYAILYRIPLNGGKKEYVDAVMPAGGGGPFFCW